MVERIVDPRKWHKCETQKLQVITVIDDDGKII